MLDAIMGMSTSTVGLVTSVRDGRINLMAVEWSYLVARSPVHFAIGAQTTNFSTQSILESGQFGLTLCAEDQASLANFVGSFSGADVDKSEVSGVTLRKPSETEVPTVAGGLVSAECVVKHVVPLPGYKLIIGEALWTEMNPANHLRPLVKHGPMYGLGAPLAQPAVSASLTHLSQEGQGPATVRLSASAFGVDRGREVEWIVSLAHDSSDDVQRIAGFSAYDDLDVDLDLPLHAGDGSHVIVRHPDCREVHLPVRQHKRR